MGSVSKSLATASPWHSGTANIAAPKDSTTRAAKDGPVWFHCSAPAVRYEGKCGADSAHASHSENEPSMKGLIALLMDMEQYRELEDKELYHTRPQACIHQHHARSLYHTRNTL